MDRTVLVTGTSTGIGRACVERLAGKGWAVFAGVRRTEDGERLVDEVPGHVRPLLLDMADAENIERAVAEVGDVVGRRGLHGLVNNAGLGLGGPVELVGLEDWRRQFEVNVFGPIALTRAAFGLVRAAGGRFVYIGSDSGRVSTPGTAPYSSSKHALEALCESMRHELAATALEVSLIEPGMVKTAIWDKTAAEVDRIDAMLTDERRDDYGFLVPATRAFIAEGKARGVSPAKVAAVVEHALTARQPRARYLVGADARALALVARLPDRVRDRIVGALTRRLARRGERLG